MNYYCTLFDSVYLSRGLAMYESLLAHSKEFYLYIFAFDNICFNILKKLDLKNVTVISLAEFENPELLRIKNSRTKAEYCWTCTPSTLSYIFEKYSVPNCTYIDADLIFFSDPSTLIDEMNENKKTVLITEHRFSVLSKLYEEKRSGRFCVQFVSFKNEKASLRVLDIWKRQCIAWCYSRHEDGKFGDQKYLDEWPELYPNVHILCHQGGGVAPWNIGRYNFRKNGNSIIGTIRKSKISFTVVFYHFQYVKFLENGKSDIGWYHIPPEIKKLFYMPYLENISEKENSLHDTFQEFKPGYAKFNTDNFWSLLKIGFKKISRYNIVKYN